LCKRNVCDIIETKGGVSIMRKFTQTEVEEVFKLGGCKLIDIYIDARTSMKYICECNEESIITLDSFKRGVRCNKCGRKKTTEKQRLDIEQVREEFIENNCIPLFDEYRGVHAYHECICECGRPAKLQLVSIRRGRRCVKCGIEKRVDGRRHHYDFVKEYFESQNCTLLSTDYENAHQLLNYICECGNKSFISFDKFLLGQRCQDCGNKKIGDTKRGISRDDMKGSNNPNYNPNKTDQERIVGRSYIEYYNWRKEVLDRDDHICQCCKDEDKSDLIAHHKDGYNWCKERRVDIANGVTLCSDCHSDFHDWFGRKDNTEEQFEKFLELKSLYNS
jgi:hypothetical protein